MTPRLLFIALLAAACAPAQVAPAPATPAPARTIGASNLADRPYGPAWTAPAFPVTDREKKQFTVEYVYRYLQQDYKPAVPLAQIARSASRQDTPEQTLIALVTAMQTLDYDWWLSLWDTRSQAIFEQNAKDKKFDTAFWKSRWQRAFQGKAVILVSRLETVHDLILEIRVGPQTPGQPTPVIPFVFRFEGGKWLATQELGDSGFIPYAGKDTLTQNLDFVPDPAYSKHEEPPIVGKSQNLFFQNQTRGAASATEYVW